MAQHCNSASVLLARTGRRRPGRLSRSGSATLTVDTPGFRRPMIRSSSPLQPHPRRSTCRRTPSFAAASEPTRLAWSSSEPIYPGWYPGRTVHIHLIVQVDERALTSQLYFPEPVNDEVLSQPPYAARAGSRHDQRRPTRSCPAAARQLAGDRGCGHWLPGRRLPDASEHIVSGPGHESRCRSVVDPPDDPVGACVEVTEPREARSAPSGVRRGRRRQHRTGPQLAS